MQQYAMVLLHGLGADSNDAVLGEMLMQSRC